MNTLLRRISGTNAHLTSEIETRQKADSIAHGTSESDSARYTMTGAGLTEMESWRAVKNPHSRQEKEIIWSTPNQPFACHGG